MRFLWVVSTSCSEKGSPSSHVTSRVIRSVPVRVFPRTIVLPKNERTPSSTSYTTFGGGAVGRKGPVVLDRGLAPPAVPVVVLERKGPLPDFVGVERLAGVDRQKLLELVGRHVLRADHVPAGHDRPRPLGDVDVHDQPLRPRPLRHLRIVHFRVHPASGLVVPEDCVGVLFQDLVDEPPRPDVREPLLLGDHQLRQPRSRDRLVAGDHDLFDRELRPFVDRDGDREDVGLLGDRVLDLRPVAPLALKGPPLVLGVLEDQVFVENLALQQVEDLPPHPLLGDAAGLEHDPRPDADPVNGYDAPVIRRLRRDQLDRSPQALLLPEELRHAVRVCPGLRLPVAVAFVEPRALQDLLTGERPRLAVEESRRRACGFPRLDVVNDEGVEGRAVEEDFGLNGRRDVALRVEAALERLRAFLQLIGGEDGALRKRHRPAHLLPGDRYPVVELERVHPEGPEEVHRDGDPAFRSLRLDPDVGEAAGGEEVPDRRAGGLLRQGLAHADGNEPLHLVVVDRPVGGVGERDHRRAEERQRLGRRLRGGASRDREENCREHRPRRRSAPVDSLPKIQNRCRRRTLIE